MSARALAPSGSRQQPVPKVEAEPASIQEQEIEQFKQQDLFLPIANVGRMMKDSLPAAAKIGKDAKESVQECASEYISFLASEAAEHSNGEKRKTLNGEDIIFALETLGFDEYARVMRIYLARYRLSIKGDSAKPKKAARQELIEEEDEEVEADED